MGYHLSLISYHFKHGLEVTESFKVHAACLTSCMKSVCAFAPGRSQQVSKAQTPPPELAVITDAQKRIGKGCCLLIGTETLPLPLMNTKNPTNFGFPCFHSLVPFSNGKFTIKKKF